MGERKPWVVPVLIVLLVVLAVGGGYLLLNSRSDAPTAAAPEASTTTTGPESGSTTATSSPASDPTWDLPEFDGSVLLTGSVGNEIRTSDSSWESKDDDWWYLVIDGTPVYDLGDSTCLDAACDVELNQLVDGGRFVWVTENASGFSDELNHAIAPSGEALGACWSQEQNGPVVVVLGADGAVIDRAWVLADHGGTTTWAGLDPSVIERGSILPLPFAGYDIPTC